MAEDFDWCNDTASADLVAAVELAVEGKARDYAWAFHEVVTDDEYNLQMIRFEGDENGNPLVGPPDDGGFPTLLQGIRRPVLLVHTATNDCLSWLNAVESEVDSLPFILFSQGYDVFLGCLRGTRFSRTAVGLDLNTSEGQELYFDYNTHTVGIMDIPAFT